MKNRRVFFMSKASKQVEKLRKKRKIYDLDLHGGSPRWQKLRKFCQYFSWKLSKLNISESLDKCLKIKRRLGNLPKEIGLKKY